MDFLFLLVQKIRTHPQVTICQIYMASAPNFENVKNIETFKARLLKDETLYVN